MKMKTLVEQAAVVQGAQPQTTNTAINSKYVSLKNTIVAFAVVQLTQAVANATQISLYQSQDVSGTGAKALVSNVPIWANEDTSVTDQFTRQADGVSYTVANTAKNKTVVFQIEANRLDINNGFDCLQVRIGASASATNFASVEFILDVKYNQAVVPSAIVD
jgi:hypothetical protein